MSPDLLNKFLKETFSENPPEYAMMHERRMIRLAGERNTFRKVIQTARGFIIAQKENPTEYSEKQLLSDLEALFFEKQITELMK